MSSERLGFVGVTTEESAINRLLPLWAGKLGIDATIEGYDLPLNASASACRDFVSSIKADRRVRGALVTSHKTALFEHAADAFDRLDDNARTLREISCISRDGNDFVGSAKDPVTAHLAFDRMVGAGHWPSNTGAEVLILGAGGAGVAIAAMLDGKSPGPSRVTVTDTAPARTAEVQRMAGVLGSTRLASVVVSSPEESDALVLSLPAGSLVVNATGMGKNLAGAPISQAATFPNDGLVWELNYRGELDFLQLAARQAKKRRLRLFDGWTYFLFGWAAVICEVWKLELTPPLFDELEAIAASLGHVPIAPEVEVRAEPSPR